MNKSSEIEIACEQFGAKTVYDAAYARMSGDRSALPRVGLPDAESLADADFIGRIAHRLMEPEECALDLAGAAIDLARLPD